jgi:hypothetical protein
MGLSKKKLPRSFQIAFAIMGNSVPVKAGPPEELMQFGQDTYQRAILDCAFRLPLRQVVEVLSEEGWRRRLRIAMTPWFILESAWWQRTARMQIVSTISLSAAVMLEWANEPLKTRPNHLDLSKRQVSSLPQLQTAAE